VSNLQLTKLPLAEIAVEYLTRRVRFSSKLKFLILGVYIKVQASNGVKRCLVNTKN